MKKPHNNSSNGGLESGLSINQRNNGQNSLFHFSQWQGKTGKVSEFSQQRRTYEIVIHKDIETLIKLRLQLKTLLSFSLKATSLKIGHHDVIIGSY